MTTPLARALAELVTASEALRQEIAAAQTVMEQAVATMRELADQARQNAERAEQFSASLDAPVWAFQVSCLDTACRGAFPVKVKDRVTADRIGETHTALRQHTCVVESLTREADRDARETVSPREYEAGPQRTAESGAPVARGRHFLVRCLADPDCSLAVHPEPFLAYPDARDRKIAHNHATFGHRVEIEEI